MKLSTRHNTVVSGGGMGDDSNFSIAMNAKMFRTLSDTMYQDKIGSMIRELSCNAMDAHVVAGDPTKPFTIHLPDQIEPWFSVKDEGIGLSDEDVRAMYTTYGESTKDQSNDVVGAFGLGSKTPFAYTDQFTVTSIFDGVKRIYVAVMNDDGLPVLKQQHEEKTTEHPGLEVTVSVNDHDFQTFREKVVQQLLFFKVKPALLNNRHNVSFPDLDAEPTLIEKDGIRVFKGGYDRKVRNIWIVQGGVGYVLSLDKLGVMEAATKRFASAMNDKGSIIEFDIGDIEVTASREGISYTPNTCKHIVKKLNEVAETIAAETIAEISQMKNIWERAAAYNGLMEVLQKAVRGSAEFAKLFPDSKVAIHHDKMIIKVQPLKDIGLKAVAYVKYVGHKRGWNGSKFVRLQRQTITDEFDRWSNDATNLHPEVQMNVFVKDTNSKPVARLAHFGEENDYPPILVIEGFFPGKNGLEVSEADIKKIAKALEMPVSNVKRLSLLTAPKSVSNGKGGEARPRAYKMPTVSGDNRYINTSNSKDWDEIYDNLDDIGEAIWVRMNRHDVSYVDNVGVLLEAAKRGLVDLPVIAVNNQTADRIEAGKVGSQLTSGKDAAKEIKDKIDALQPMFRARAKYKEYLDKVASGNRYVQQAIQGSLNGLGSVAKRIEQLEKRLEGWQWAENRGDSDLVQKAYRAGREAGEKRYNVFKERYPLLSHLHTYDKIPVEHIEDYMKMVDERG